MAAERPFEHIPSTPSGHLNLYLYGAVLCLLGHVEGLAEAGGPTVAELAGRLPFLARYEAEIRRFLPPGLSLRESLRWWRAAIEDWEGRQSEHLPLARLADAADLGFRNLLALAGVGLVEEDSRFGTVFAELQAPLAERRPMVELVGRLLAADGEMAVGDGWSWCRPLAAAGLVEVLNPEAPRSERLLRVLSELWDAVRGETFESPAGWCRFLPGKAFPAISELIHAPGCIGRLENLPGLLAAGRVDCLVLRADGGGDALEVAGSLAAALGHHVFFVADGAANREAVSRLLGPLCTLAGALPVFRYETGPGDTVQPPELRAYRGPVVLLLGFEGGLGSPSAGRSFTLTLDPPGRELRERHWRKAFGDAAVEDLDAIAATYHISGAYIRDVAGIALAGAQLDGRAAVRLQDVREASRCLNRQNLDALAEWLEPKGGRDDLVVAATTADKLCELEQRCRHRERLLGELGPAFANSVNRGVRALFTGASGTGKTLAAKILAAELGMDLYRVDLAAVINKYIGETEKNLHRVLARAEALDVVLLLDEGDALLGARTDVKSANDRYANLETNYLLQRLETYQGIVLVTTNLVENVDRAFQRRMDVVVPFFLPKAEERLRILEGHLSPDHRIDSGYLRTVALRCHLTGGQLRNTALHASLLALDEGVAMAEYHLEEALRSEFRKAGATFPLAERGASGRAADGGMEALIAALDAGPQIQPARRR